MELTARIKSAVLMAVVAAGVLAGPAAAQPYAYVLGKVFGTPSWRSYVTVVNTATNTKGVRIRLGATGGSILPQAMAMAPDGARIYVSNDYEFTVSVISTQTHTVVDTWPTSLVGTNPFALAVSPDNTILYVVGFHGSLIAIDIATKTQIANLPVGQGPLRGLAVSPDGARVYVTAYPVTGPSASVTVIRTKPFAVMTSVALPANSRPYGLSITPDGRAVYIALPFSGGLQQNSSIAVLDTATNAIVATPVVGPSHYYVLASPNGAVVYTGGFSALARLDPVSHTVAGTTPRVSTTYGVSFTADSATAYLASSANVVAINTATHTVITSIPFDANVDGYASSIVTTPPPFTPPGSPAPSALAAAVTGNRVTLTWNAPTTGGTPTGYLIEGGLTPGDALASVATGSASPGYTFDAPTGSYYLRVHAQTAAGRSPASNEIRIAVNVPQPPSAPTNLLGLVVGDTLSLAWKNTASGGVPAGLRLDVSGALSGSAPMPLSESFSFSGVPPGTYTFTVRAMNASGVSAAAAPVTLTFPATCSGVPQTPASPTLTRAGAVVTFTWDPPAAGAAPTNYLVSASGSITGSAPTTTRSLSGAVPPGTYTLTVRAVNACGQSADSAPQTVTVP